MINVEYTTSTLFILDCSLVFDFSGTGINSYAWSDEKYSVFSRDLKIFAGYTISKRVKLFSNFTF